MAGQNTQQFDDGNFDEQVLQNSQPVLVDFWAEWCGPCQMLGPVIDELASEFAGKVVVGKVDIDKAVRVASQFQVLNIPTVLLFANGQEVARLVGLRTKRDYVNAITQKAGLAV